MPVEKKPVQVLPLEGNFIEHNKTAIQLPKPAQEMTQDDWMRLATMKNSPLGKVTIDNTSFTGLHVVLKDKNYIPMWLYAGGLNKDNPDLLDSLTRARQMGAELISTLDDIELPTDRYRMSADGHIHVNDVVLAKMPAVTYYAMQYQNLVRANNAINAESQEAKAYEGMDGPRHIKGNKDVALYDTQEHTVQYSDRSPRF